MDGTTKQPQPHHFVEATEKIHGEKNGRDFGVSSLCCRLWHYWFPKTQQKNIFAQRDTHFVFFLIGITENEIMRVARALKSWEWSEL